MKEISLEKVNMICANHRIQIKNIELPNENSDRNIFLINQEYLLRISVYPMTLEQEKFRRIAALNFVPRILHTGTLEINTKPIYYTILTMLRGDDFVNAYRESTLDQQKQLGMDVALFLDDLHKINGSQYDIGLYIPIISPFSGTWKDGHQKYWEILKQQTAELNLTLESDLVLKNAFKFLRASVTALDFQMGPKLLHNDFHPKNFLLHQGKFSGVIDWECSQFGEADFELCHLIHWCVYPPHPEIDYRPFLQALFESAPKCTQVPNLALRLTIYQIEHEIQQIIWHGNQAESLRVPRIAYWLDSRIDCFLREKS